MDAFEQKEKRANSLALLLSAAASRQKTVLQVSWGLGVKDQDRDRFTLALSPPVLERVISNHQRFKTFFYRHPPPSC